MKYFIGADVHWRRTMLCILDENGRVVKRLVIRGAWEKAAEALRQFEGPKAVCYEASCGYGYLYDLFSPVVSRVVVAHPGQLRLIFRSKRKNDRVDAEKLAKLLYFDEVPPVHVPPAKVREWRQLIEFRHRLIAKRTQAKNSCRSLLRSLGIRPPSRPGLWTQRGMRWLQSLQLPGELYAVRRDLLCDQLEQFGRQIRQIEAVLAKFSQKHPAVFQLCSIPGVGLRTAEAMVAYLDDPQRFAHNKSVGSYFGLVPAQDQSGSVNRLGHITREGPASVRRLLTEAAWQGIRHSPTIAAYFHRVQHGDPQRKKIALVATAHYLARVMHALLCKGELWTERVAA